MSKRKRSNKLIEQLTNETSEPAVQESAAVSEDPATESILAPNKVTVEIEEKLVKVEDLEKANSQLFQEKSDLTESLSTYIEENTSLKMQVNKLTAQIEQLKQQVADEVQKTAAAQNQADEYLLKISDMSYELAQLKTELQMNKRPVNSETDFSATTSNQKVATVTTSPVVYNKPKRYRRLLPRNGYSSWN